MSSLDNFAVFILTRGRPDRQHTYRSLRKQGYTGKIYLVVEDTDPTLDQYRQEYGEEVIVFSKSEIIGTFDEAGHMNDRRVVVYARNVNFDLAERLGIRYFMQLDDDYHYWHARFDSQMRYQPKGVVALDRIFAAMLDYLKSAPLYALAMAQGGDFIGGIHGTMAKAVTARRKVMNSFIFDCERRVYFKGRINEDVNLYVESARLGMPMITTSQVSIEQAVTQSNSAGMTDIYLANGTYVKSFYSVMMFPSSVSISTIRGRSATRIHHRVDWKRTATKILSPEHKKSRADHEL